MPKRSRDKDEYPEWIRTKMNLTVLDVGVTNSTTSTVQLQDWVLPVEINLTHPMFIELNSLTCWIDAADTEAQASTTATAGQLALDRMVHVYVLNERRTAEPTLSDNAIIARFVLNHRMSFGLTTSGANNIIHFDNSKSKLRDHREYEDEKTGFGLLISQPRIFLLVVEVDTQAAQELGHTDATQVGLKMTFRLTERVSAKEFLTNMIASVS